MSRHRDQNNRSPSSKAQRVKSPGKFTSASRKSLSFVDDANNISRSEIGNGKSRWICVEDEPSTRLNIDDLPSSKELQVKVVILSEDGTVKVRVPADLTI